MVIAFCPAGRLNGPILYVSFCTVVSVIDSTGGVMLPLSTTPVTTWGPPVAPSHAIRVKASPSSIVCRNNLVIDNGANIPWYPP